MHARGTSHAAAFPSSSLRGNREALPEKRREQERAGAGHERIELKAVGPAEQGRKYRIRFTVLSTYIPEQKFRRTHKGTFAVTYATTRPLPSLRARSHPLWAASLIRVW